MDYRIRSHTHKLAMLICHIMAVFLHRRSANADKP